MYNETVPPVILDGGKDILLANFQGPRSLKCTSINGGLAKPAPEHTYAVVDERIPLRLSVRFRTCKCTKTT